jgi:signal transduction histidine kinase
MNNTAISPPGEFGQALLRFGVGALAFVYLALAREYGLVQEADAPLRLFGIYLSGALLHVVLARYRPSPSRRRRIWTIGLDALFIPALLGQGGAALAPFICGPAFVSIGNGIRFGPVWAYLCSAAGAVSLSLAMFFSPFWRALPFLSAGIVIATLALPIYAARLSLYLVHKKLEMEKHAQAMEEHARQAQELLKERQDELAHLSRLHSTTEIAMGIAHEINQPLAAILSYNQACIRLLRQDGPDLAEIARALESSVAQARRAGAIIHRLRSFINKADVQSTEIDLNGALLDALALVRFGAGESRVAVDALLAPAPLPILADAVQIQQVVVNILRNAFDALDGVHADDRSAPAVLVTSRAADGRALVEIADNGPGFEAHALARIFYPFFTTKSQGMGLGLTISQTIVDSFGGTIAAARRDGGGALFTLSFPLHTPAATP